MSKIITDVVTGLRDYASANHISVIDMNGNVLAKRQFPVLDEFTLSLCSLEWM